MLASLVLVPRVSAGEVQQRPARSCRVVGWPPVGVGGVAGGVMVRIMAGTLPPMTGTRMVDPGVTVGYLPQGTLDLETGTLGETL